MITYTTPSAISSATCVQITSLSRTRAAGASSTSALAACFSARCTSASFLISSTLFSSSSFICTSRLFHVLKPVDHDTRYGGNDLAVARMVGRERRQHKLPAIRHFHIRHVVSRSAGPSSLGPQTITFAALQRHPGEAGSLIVGVTAFTRVIAFQQLHHLRCARRIRDLSRHDLHHQARGRVGGQLIAILAVWTTRHTLTTVRIFAER